MLHKSWISNIQIYTPEWDAIRRGKLTSSRFHTLMAKEGLGVGANTYIYQKAGEFITGKSVSDEGEEYLEDENTVWGLEHEATALNLFGIEKKIKYLVVQKIIFNPNGNTSSTPDALWIIDSSVIKEDCYNVATIEVKCPRKYHKFFPMYACETPEDLKKKYSVYYWQKLHQMHTCSAAVGYFVCYHPFFPPGKNMRIIEFRKIDLWNDFILLQQREAEAIQKMKDLIRQFDIC
jgi:hypothetical protein